MKRLLTAFLLMCISSVLAEPDPPWSWNSALPLQAAVCDLVGVGLPVQSDGTNTTLQITQLWWGDPTNTVTLTTRELVPTNNVNIVFFISKYQTFLDIEPMEHCFFYIFDMNYHRSKYEPDGFYFFDENRSWFPVNAENEAMMLWSSNLVHAAQVTTNRQAFYELIRDGYRLHPESSRIHRDSEYTFMFFHYFNDVNYMQQVWTDPKLVGHARDWVNMSYQRKTRTWLPRLNAVPAPPKGGEP